MTDHEAIAKMSQRVAEALDLHAQQARLIRMLKKQMMDERDAAQRTIVRQQNDIDALITEKIESDFVKGELKKRVAELNEVIETLWQDVKLELPKGL